MREAVVPLIALYFLIRNSGRMISCVDDATTREVVLLDEVNHAGIGMVGVNADVAALC